MAAVVFAALVGVLLSGCQWRGLNSITMPGTEGNGPGSFDVQAQLPNVNNLQPNSRVRVDDVNVGTVTKIERQGWHALVTIRLNGDVSLPENATAKLGQTSLLGSQHVELAPPAGVPPTGRLRQGSLIPLQNAGAYPTTEQTLAAVSLLFNGGGVGQLHDIVETLSTALRGREKDLRSLIEQLDRFVGYVDGQTGDIIDATTSLDRLAGTFANQRPVVDRALQTIPDALSVLKDEREHLAEALDQLGKFSAVAADSVNQTKVNLVAELKDLAPVVRSLANAGPALTRSLGMLAAFPFPIDTLQNWLRGDYGNLSVTIDLTLSRLDQSFFTGTRFEGDLTKLELQWGRTIGQMPSPYTYGNPLIAPYHLDQGP
ncbi:virulence factor Mce family protein [Mycolicibacterium stellerae]|uniref:virulence factor Mce family protein n=1 Tax=Mycolicibacterium stellerae TaxID=2358193 RepID=UPI0013DDC722